MPTVNGKITSPLHADTFSILKTTKVPDAAWNALKAMVASPDLLTTYGAMPADKTKQKAWEATIDKGFPGIKLDWSVPERCSRTRTSPTTSPGCPTTPRPRRPCRHSRTSTGPRPELISTAELATLKTTLQGIFDAAPKS